jgi:hypothetical protein
MKIYLDPNGTWISEDGMNWQAAFKVKKRTNPDIFFDMPNEASEVACAVDYHVDIMQQATVSHGMEFCMGKKNHPCYLCEREHNDRLFTLKSRKFLANYDVPPRKPGKSPEPGIHSNDPKWIEPGSQYTRIPHK